MNNTEQQFLKELDDKLWKAADKLRASLDAANYKHVVLGLIFLKYVTDAFEERQEQLLELFQQGSNDNIYYLPREDFASDEEYQQALQDELEQLDYYREANVFWVPKAARWSTLKEKAVLPVGSVIWQDDAGNDVKLRSVSWLVDNALEEIEKSNVKLKGILNRISQYQLENDKLIGLINTFSDTSFTKPVYAGETLHLHSKDILGHVYEYFLGQFALAEGKQGGQYLYAEEYRYPDCRDAPAILGSRVRSGHGLRWVLCFLRQVHRRTCQRAALRRYRAEKAHFGIRPGIKPDNLEAGGHEHGNPWYRLQLW